MAHANEIILKLTAENEQLKTKLNEAEKDVKKFTDKVENEGSRFASVMKKFAGAVAIGFGVSAIKGMIDFGREVNNVSEGFKNLAVNAQGGADGLLKAMKTASKGTIAEIDIMKSANLALQLMGEDVANYLPKMTEIAAGIAKAQGKSTAEMLNDIVVASGRQSVMILDNLGVSSVRAGQLIEEYANKLGKTREKLTDSEKSAAFFYATMKAGEEVLQRSGGITEDFGTRVDKLYASIDDLKSKGIQLLLPLLDGLVRLLNLVADGTIWVTEKIKEMLNWIASWVVEKIKEMLDWIARSDKALFFLSMIPGMQSIVIGMRYKAQIEDAQKKQPKPTIKPTTTLTTTPKKSPGAGGDTYINYAKEFEEAAKKVAEGFEKIQQAAQAGNLAEVAKQMQELRNQGLLTADANSQFVRTMNEIAYISTIQNYAVDSLGNTFKNFEAISKQMIYEVMWGKNGWNNFLKNFKEIVKQLIAEIVYLTVKALALQAVLSTIGVGGFGGAGIGARLLSKVFERGYVPAYPNGRIPAYPSGYVPNDHFLAYIGTKEAVIRKEATQANRDILAWMNANNGQRYPNEIILTSIVQIDGNEIGRAVDKYRDTVQSLTGYYNYHRKSL